MSSPNAVSLIEEKYGGVEIPFIAGSRGLNSNVLAYAECTFSTCNMHAYNFFFILSFVLLVDQSYPSGTAAD